MGQSQSIQPLLVDVKKAREVLGGIGNNTFWNLVKKGEIELVGSERKRFVVVESLNAYVARQRLLAASRSTNLEQHKSPSLRDVR